MNGKLVLGLLLVLALIWGEAVLVWHLAKPPVVAETPVPAQRQADGSIVLERTATQPQAKPAHTLPKRAKLERVVKVAVKPKDAGQEAHIDMSLVRLPDQSRRVVVSSPDGEVTGGIDVPVETPAPPAPHLWAAGVSYDPLHHSSGVWVERDVGRVRVGMDLNQAAPLPTLAAHGAELRLRIGWTF